MVVNPCTPDDKVNINGMASRSRTSPTMATSGAMRRNPATSRRRSTSLRSGRAGRVCMCATFGSGMSVSKTSSATTTRRLGSSSAARQLSNVVLPDPGCAGNQDRQSATHARLQEAGRGRVQHAAVDQLGQRSVDHPGELADIDQHVAVAADVGVHDVQPGPVVELGVLQPLGRIQLAMRPAGVVEDLGQHPDDVVVVVEDLVVISPGAGVPFGKNSARSIDHYFPHVGIFEQRLERAIAGQVPQRPLDRRLGIGNVERPQSFAVFLLPPGYLLIEQRPQLLDERLARPYRGLVPWPPPGRLARWPGGEKTTRRQRLRSSLDHSLGTTSGPHERNLHSPRPAGKGWQEVWATLVL